MARCGQQRCHARAWVQALQEAGRDVSSRKKTLIAWRDKLPSRRCGVSADDAEASRSLGDGAEIFRAQFSRG